MQHYRSNLERKLSKAISRIWTSTNEKNGIQFLNKNNENVGAKSNLSVRTEDISAWKESKCGNQGWVSFRDHNAQSSSQLQPKLNGSVDKRQISKHN